MAFLVEQVNTDGTIVCDYDQTLSVRALYERIVTYFPGIYRDEDGIICGVYQGRKYSIRAKNVSYLGNPHPVFKKRIQIANDLKEFYQASLAKGYRPILLGVYTYKQTVLFCAFRIEDFIYKKAHNSSAHVYSSDLSDAAEHDYFQKTDYFGNQITVFSPKGVEVFLRELFENTGQTWGTPDLFSVDVSNPMPQHIVQEILTFFQDVHKEWHGIDCYRQMIAANYRNKYQPEWAGFYLEFLFEQYLVEHQLQDDIRYAQDKSKNGIDLDLYFPTIGCYGDLKTHSIESRGVQGNDWDTVFSLIDGNPRGHLYYLVCEHETIKDRVCNYEVTEYWNRALHKENLRSYGGRMKNQVTLADFYLLDINDGNKQFLSQFKQGINSNGKPRAPKIMVERDQFKNFAIAKMPLL